jgi:hypothetical protein
MGKVDSGDVKSRSSLANSYELQGIQNPAKSFISPFSGIRSRPGQAVARKQVPMKVKVRNGDWV